MSQKTRFYLPYKNAVLIILNRFNKVWDRQQHPGETTILVCLLGWGLSFIWRILQEITFTWRLWRQAIITSYFNLNFILRADSAQCAAVIHNNGKRFPSGKKSSLITPNLAFLNLCQWRNFNWKVEKISLISTFHIISQIYWSNSYLIRMNTSLSKLFLQLLPCHSSCMKYYL